MGRNPKAYRNGTRRYTGPAGRYLFLQAVTALEIRIANVIRFHLVEAEWSESAVKPYEDLTLGGKLRIPKTDPRSLETYSSHLSDFSNMFTCLVL